MYPYDLYGIGKDLFVIGHEIKYNLSDIETIQKLK